MCAPSPLHSLTHTTHLPQKPRSKKAALPPYFDTKDLSARFELKRVRVFPLPHAGSEAGGREGEGEGGREVVVVVTKAEFDALVIVSHFSFLRAHCFDNNTVFPTNGMVVPGQAKHCLLRLHSRSCSGSYFRLCRHFHTRSAWSVSLPSHSAPGPRCRGFCCWWGWRR